MKIAISGVNPTIMFDWLVGEDATMFTGTARCLATPTAALPRCIRPQEVSAALDETFL